MRLPVIQATIRRRILANFRVDPEVIQRELPNRFRPKLQNGFAIAGICLIRLEHVRPRMTPEIIGVASENAAHRVAVVWEEHGQPHEGVFISRRDSNSQLNRLLGGCLFPGEHHHAQFSVADSDGEINLKMKSDDATVVVEVDGRGASDLPPTSVFSSVAETSTFFEKGSIGYSLTRDLERLDGLELHTTQWHVEPLEISNIYSSYFADKEKFPEGTVDFDHALIMRNIDHEWHTVDDLYI
jgi:hypothetical protein